MKSTVIFADQHQEGEKTSSQSKNKTKIILSRDEYREVVKEAYKEGLKDAAKKETPESSLNKTYVEKKQATQAALKSEARKESETKQKLDAIAARKDIELLRAKTMFPFNLFPDTLIIDTTKVTIIRKQFFATEFITTIPLKDLSDATVQTALFLAGLYIEYMPQASSPGMLKPAFVRLNSLKRADAIRAKNILKGALVAKAEDIDIAKLSPEEVVNVIEKFGANEGVN